MGKGDRRRASGESTLFELGPGASPVGGNGSQFSAFARRTVHGGKLAGNILAFFCESKARGATS